jgi:general secretion pathway protein G
MRRSAFTMVEIVMVIIVLGVLMSVAISKLATSRDDAEYIRIVSSVKQATKEIIEHTTALGVMPTNSTVDDYSANIVNLKNLDYVTSTLRIKSKAGNTLNCARIVFNDTNKTMTLQTTGSDTSVECTNLRSALGISDSNPMVYKIAGRKAVF